MKNLSEEYGKFLIRLQIEDCKYFMVWGYLQENSDEYVLLTDDGKVALFSNPVTMKEYIERETSLKELKEWSKRINGNDIQQKEVNLNILEKIEFLTFLDVTNIEIWQELSLVIELFDDLNLYNDIESNEKLMYSIDLFREIYNNNFVWKGQEKLNYKITTSFLNAVKTIIGSIKENVVLVRQ